MWGLRAHHHMAVHRPVQLLDPCSVFGGGLLDLRGKGRIECRSIRCARAPAARGPAKFSSSWLLALALAVMAMALSLLLLLSLPSSPRAVADTATVSVNLSSGSPRHPLNPLHFGCHMDLGFAHRRRPFRGKGRIVERPEIVVHLAQDTCWFAHPIVHHGTHVLPAVWVGHPWVHGQWVRLRERSVVSRNVGIRHSVQQVLTM
jgi:hypothetical protein